MATSVSVGTSTVPTKTYLQQCVEDLEPSNLSSLQQKATLWQVASVATLVAYTALAVTGLGLATMYAPIYIPILAVASLFLLGPTQKGANIFEKWAAEANARAEQIKEVSQNCQTMSSATTRELQLNLQQKGIHWFTIPGMVLNPSNIDTLKPLIARHAFWEKWIEKIEADKTSKLAEATKLATENYEKNKEEINQLREKALNLENNALQSKIKNAFINAVIRRPDFKGALENVGTFSPMTGPEHAIGAAVGATSAAELFTFKNGNVAALTIDEVKRSRVPDLAVRLLAGMA
jgi:hypothetical protein